MTAGFNLSNASPISRSPLDKNPMPGHLSELHPVNEVDTKGQFFCHPAISSFAVPFSSCPQSLPASGSFPVSRLFTWCGQSIGVSALGSVLPMNIQDCFPLGLTGLISFLSKGDTNTRVQKHQFFGAQLSLQSNSHIHPWLLDLIATPQIEPTKLWMWKTQDTCPKITEMHMKGMIPWPRLCIFPYVEMC